MTPISRGTPALRGDTIYVGRNVQEIVQEGVQSTGSHGTF